MIEFIIVHDQKVATVCTLVFHMSPIWNEVSYYISFSSGHCVIVMHECGTGSREFWFQAVTVLF